MKICGGMFGGIHIKTSAITSQDYEKLEKFIERVKKRKDYNENFILKELYDYIHYSNDLLEALMKKDKELMYKESEIFDLKAEMNAIEEKIEKWKSMYTGQCEANKILINKLGDNK